MIIGQKERVQVACTTPGCLVSVFRLVWPPVTPDKRKPMKCPICLRAYARRWQRQLTLAKSDREVLQARADNRRHLGAILSAIHARDRRTATDPRAPKYCTCGALAIGFFRTRGLPDRPFCRKHKP